MKKTNYFLRIIIAVILTFAVSVPSFAAVDDTGFSDVAANSWYAEAVQYVRDNDIMGGTSSTLFAPGNTMTRSMLATVLYRAKESPAVTGTDSFTDTDSNSWYSNAVLWASQQNLINGYGNSLFGTNNPVSREEIAAILWRYDGSPAAESTSGFADASAISGWAVSGVNWAKANGIINGRANNEFDSKASATRGEVSAILHNYLTMETEESTDLKDSKILIAYFSLPETSSPDNMSAEEANSTVVIDGQVLGNTQYMAQVIQENTKGEIFRIEAKTPYPLNHETLVTQAQKEQNEKARPEIALEVNNIAEYDTIFLGYPNWWGDMPMILYTFLEKYDLSGKTIIPFNTHGGSGFSGTVSKIQELESNATVSNKGLSISRNNIQDAEAEIVSWLEGLGY